MIERETEREETKRERKGKREEKVKQRERGNEREAERNIIQCKLLNVIALGRRETDNINRVITISKLV